MNHEFYQKQLTRSVSHLGRLIFSLWWQLYVCCHSETHHPPSVMSQQFVIFELQQSFDVICKSKIRYTVTIFSSMCAYFLFSRLDIRGYLSEERCELACGSPVREILQWCSQSVSEGRCPPGGRRLQRTQTFLQEVRRGTVHVRGCQHLAQYYWWLLFLLCWIA